MRSYFKLFLLITITLFLSACGGAGTTTGEVASNPLVDATDPVIDNSDQRVVSIRIASGMDDAEEQIDGEMYVDSSDLELINDGENQLVGLRYAVPIPQDAVITQANLRFTTDETTTGEADLVIWAQASDDAEVFTSSSGNLSRRGSTLESVTWKPQAWVRIGESSTAQTTSDLSALIQEVVRRPGWQSGNFLVLIFSGLGVRTAYSYEGDATKAPVLTIGYTTTTGAAGGGNSNHAPTISGVPGSGATEGIAYSFTPNANDVDGDTLTFAVSNKPAWAAFDSQSGTLSGIPGEGDAGSYDNISITVSDGEFSATLDQFSILVSSGNQVPVTTVANQNRPPMISGTPGTSVVAGNGYSFTPTASDADGDSLTFSISNLPAWASFDSATGTLAGTPQESDAGNYANINITVSDGSDSVALNAFTISVTTAVVTKGSISLSWIAPSTRADGSVLNLSEIGGYEVYLGTSSSNLQRKAVVNDGSSTAYTINDLELGTYYIAVTTIDTGGVASSFSNIVSKDVTN